MELRIGTFNVENLFDRPRAMGREPNPEVLAAHARFGAAIAEVEYAERVRREILECLEILGLLRSDSAAYARLRQVRGRLIRRPRTGDPEIVARGRSDWVGWAELTDERVDELAITHLGQVIREVGAHILALVEAENRIVAKQFTDAELCDVEGEPLYPHVMVIDGNDERGIDVGVISRGGWPVRSIRSHVDDLGPDGRRIFSRDCPVFTYDFPAGTALEGQRLHVLANHFKSKGYGRQADNDRTRTRQATRVAEIYRELRDAGEDFVVVAGDLNDTPQRPPLAPLLTGTDLREIATLDGFDDGGRPGTYGNGTKSQKIDYLLLSPALAERTTGGAIFREGVWGGRNGTLFPHFPTMTAPEHAASDHAALYADIDVG
ncbi:endonuclease/exonuclease/phosphatase family protein [Nocardia puris]|uniref:Endonuclease/exonuclease/phosphatase domain-containing protein n=1 Tax=Nocardia puris TaxID=208602 RepID=A0A366DE39_9NOCA|nr:endonuclease/exonuclease/phosphatase family protein [Nocardia puris]RBO88303.1 hypothetical protein DFR74_10970 [Nocardia puris]